MKKRYTIPRLYNPALVILTYGLIELTVRQCTLLLLGAIIVFNLWPPLGFFSLPVGGLVLPFGWITIEGRSIEAWIIVLLRYRFSPRTYLWPSQETNETRKSA